MLRLRYDSVSMMLRLDSFGALLSAGLLGLGLARYESVFGMPQLVLWRLAYIALGFCLFALLGSFLAPKGQRTALGAMIVNNSLYSLLTMVAVGLHWGPITLFGLLYFVGEILVVGVLVTFELRVFRRA